MRNIIIRSFETILWVFGGLIAIGGMLAGLAALAQGQWQGLIILIGAPLYAILILGMFFIVIAIQENTKRTAEAVEKLAAK